MEEWKKIPNFPNYEVSTLGNVRNKNGCILRKMKNSGGRNFVDLGRENRGKLISRLCAETYLERIPGKDEVDHINGDHTDDRLCNLQWIDRSGNLCKTRDRGTSSGERCIYKTPASFLVQIVRHKKVVYRKNFSTLKEAIQNRNHFLNTYNQAQNQNHGTPAQ